MKIASKIIAALAVMWSMTAVAGRCELCNAQILGRQKFCSRCKNKPEAKKMQDVARANAAKEKQKKELLEIQRRPLKLKTFLGHEFLAKSNKDQKCLTVKLKKPFRGFSEAQLYYTPLGRIYRISITNSFSTFTCADVENEVSAIAHILEKKYDFKFPNGVVCDCELRSRGDVCVPSAAAATPIWTQNLGRTRYTASRKWSDVTIDVCGVIYGKADGDRSPCVSVTVSMPEVLKADADERKKLSTTDESGIDVL